MITCVLPTTLTQPTPRPRQQATEVAARFYQTFITAGIIDIANEYNAASWVFRDGHEAMQKALDLCEDLKIVWQEGA